MFQKLILILTLIILFASCKKENNNNNYEGVFIEINNDLRKPSLVEKDYYQIELSKYPFNETSSEPSGIQFIMDIRDYNQEYIGGIGGITKTAEIEVYIDVYTIDLDVKKTLKTMMLTGSETKAFKQNKCTVRIRMKDKEDKNVADGNALDNQNITVEKINGEYKVYFNKLNFGNGTKFTGSGRIITR